MNSSKPTKPPKKIQVLDFYFNPATITYKGKSVRVMDLELFQMFIQQLMKGNQVAPPMTRKQAYEEFFFGFDL